MDKFLQEKLMPIAIKLEIIKKRSSGSDGITLAVPLLLIGSLFMVIASFPVPGWKLIWQNWGFYLSMESVDSSLVWLVW